MVPKTFFFFHFFAERSSWGMLLRSTRKAAMAGSEKKIPTVSAIYQPAKTSGTASSSTGSSTTNPSASYSRAANARYVPKRVSKRSVLKLQRHSMSHFKTFGMINLQYEIRIFKVFLWISYWKIKVQRHNMPHFNALGMINLQYEIRIR